MSDFTISPDGHYRLCLPLIAPGTVYDLRTGTLRDAWERFTPAVRGLLAEAPQYLARCGPCPMRARCGQCPAIAYLETGAMDGVPEYFCALTQHVGEACTPRDEASSR